MGFLSDIGGAIGQAATFGGGGITSLLGPDTIGDMATGGAISNAKSVADTNQMQMQLSQKQMDFQERMSNTAYERAMADMRKSGLNPMLAMNNGGASQPSGQMATLTAPRKGDIGAGLLNTAKSVATGIPEIQNTQAQTGLAKANTELADANVDKASANARESDENTALVAAQRQKVNLDREKARHEIRERSAIADQAERDNSISKNRYDIDKAAAKYDAIATRVGQAAGIINTAKKAGSYGTPAPSLPTRGNTSSYLEGLRRGRREGTPVD